MSVTAIDKRLTDRFRLLRGAGRGGLERHQTLRAAVQWSYDLLDDEEKALFDRLSVFAGQFDLEAAEAICSDDLLVDEFDVVDLQASLVDKSMVQSDRSGEATAFTLLETFRQFGEEKLIDRGELAERRDVHLNVYIERTAKHREHYEGTEWQAGQTGFDFGLGSDSCRRKLGDREQGQYAPVCFRTQLADNINSDPAFRGRRMASAGRRQPKPGRVRVRPHGVYVPVPRQLYRQCSGCTSGNRSR